MMGLWPLGQVRGSFSSLIAPYYPMAENGDQEEQEFYPPVDMHNHPQRHQAVIVPSSGQRRDLNHSFSFQAAESEETSQSTLPSARSLGEHDEDNNRKPAARLTDNRGHLDPMNSFARHSPNTFQETFRGVPMPGHHHTGEHHTQYPYLGHSYGEYGPETPPHGMSQYPTAVAASTENMADRSLFAARSLGEDEYRAQRTQIQDANKKPSAKKTQNKKHAHPQRRRGSWNEVPREAVRRSPRASKVKKRTSSPVATVQGEHVQRTRQAREGERLIVFYPSEEETAECPNHRKLVALKNFYERLNELSGFKARNDHCNVPQQYSPNPRLGVWVNKIRMEKKKFDRGERSSLNATRISKLELLSFNWGTNKGDPKWEEHFGELLAYHRANHHCNVPTKYSSNPALGRWVSTQRCEYKKFMRGEDSLINQDKVDRLVQLGFIWVMLSNE